MIDLRTNKPETTEYRDMILIEEELHHEDSPPTYALHTQTLASFRILNKGAEKGQILRNTTRLEKKKKKFRVHTGEQARKHFLMNMKLIKSVNVRAQFERDYELLTLEKFR